MVSTAGGNKPRWRRDGKELFYLAGRSPIRLELTAVASDLGSSPPVFGTPRPLFTFSSVTTIPEANGFPYAPSADGQSFLLQRFTSYIPPTLDVLRELAEVADGKAMTRCR